MENFSNRKFNFFEENNTKVEIEFENCSEWYDYCGMKVCDAPFHFIDNGKRCEGNYPNGVIWAHNDYDWGLQYFWYTSRENIFGRLSANHEISERNEV